jgi:hypothetical protein
VEELNRGGMNCQYRIKQVGKPYALRLRYKPELSAITIEAPRPALFPPRIFGFSSLRYSI